MMTGALWRVAILVGLAVAPAAAEVIHEERSVYRNVLVVDEGGLRCLCFAPLSPVSRRQSCRFLDGSKRLALEYSRMIMAGLLLTADPREILIVGLGGGTLPMAFADLLPQARITSVEVDPAVARAARQYFGYRESDRIQTVIEDARVHVKRLGRSARRVDLVVLDAFTADYIPEHLMTKQFLEEVRATLGPAGLVIANTFVEGRLYHHEAVTYEAVFRHLVALQSSRSNRLLFAADRPIVFPEASADAVRRLQDRLTPYAVDLTGVLRTQRAPDWDRSARVLTDAYAPVNLLRR